MTLKIDSTRRAEDLKFLVKCCITDHGSSSPDNMSALNAPIMLSRASLKLSQSLTMARLSFAHARRRIRQEPANGWSNFAVIMSSSSARVLSALEIARCRAVGATASLVVSTCWITSRKLSTCSYCASATASIVFQITLAHLQGFYFVWGPVQLGDAVQTICYHLTEGKDAPYRSQNLSHGKRRAKRNQELME